MTAAPSPTDPLIIAAWIGGTFLIVALILIAVKWARHRERQRIVALRTATIRLGLEYQMVDEDGSFDFLSRFELSNRGHSRQVRDVITGPWSGEDILFCNYRYVTGHGKHQQAHRQSVLCMTLAGGTPDLLLAPEGFFAKVGQALFGTADINFLMHPEFSKLYVLRGSDEEAVRAFFETGPLEYFEKRPGLSVEVRDGVCVFFRANKRCRPEDLEAFLVGGLEIKATLQGLAPTR